MLILAPINFVVAKLLIQNIDRRKLLEGSQKSVNIYFLREIIRLWGVRRREKKNYIVLLGMLEMHQRECEKGDCPCKDGEGTFISYDLFLTMKSENDEVRRQGVKEGVWFPDLLREESKFELWIEDFIEFWFMINIFKHNKSETLFDI